MTTEERRRHKEREVRAAMGRILTGGAIHTGGACNASTLAAEAGVSRQDVYRSFRALLEEFRATCVGSRIPGRPPTGEARTETAR